jgi:hypothetical protein
MQALMILSCHDSAVFILPENWRPAENPRKAVCDEHGRFKEGPMKPQDLLPEGGKSMKMKVTGDP